MNRRNPSRLEVMMLASELDKFLRGDRISSLYHNSGLGLTLLKMSGPNGPQRLLYERGLRACLTDFQYPFPKEPPQQLRKIRRSLRGSRVTEVRQEGFDRIISIELTSPKDETMRILMEMLPGGVFAILDSERTITYATERKIMKDRSIVLGEEYRLPPQPFPSPFDIDVAEFVGILNEGPDLKSVLESKLGLGNLSEPVLQSAGFGLNTPSSTVSAEGAEKLLYAARSVATGLRPAPVVYVGESGPIDYSLVPLPTPPASTRVSYDTISGAMDSYYSGGGKITVAKAPRPNRKVIALRKAADELLSRSMALRKAAELVMAEPPRFDRALSIARQNRLGDLGDGTVLKDIDYGERTVRLSSNGFDVRLHLSMSAAANASVLFSESKAMGERAEELTAQADAVKVTQKPVEIRLKRVAKRAWYEKFRWAKLSSSRMLLLGRDAVTNEILVKKYASAESQVFHSDFSGSPFALAWPLGEMTSSEIREAADITASYTTKAWEMGFSSLDVYWVRGAQLSKTPPSGTYLARGAFQVTGERSFVRGATLQIALKVTAYGGSFSVTAMHPDAEPGTPHVVLAPGRHDNASVSKKLAKMFSNRLSIRTSSDLGDAIREKIPDRRSEIVSIKDL